MEYHVATTGNDSNDGSSGSPKLTIPAGIALIGQGDILSIHDGTYVDTLTTESGYTGGSQVTFPSGSSWSNAPIIRANPGDTVTIKTPSGRGNALFITGAVGGVGYLIFDGLIFDGHDGNSTVIGIYDIYNPVHHIRLANCEVKNAGRFMGNMGSASSPTNTSGITGGGLNFHMINCNVHDNGNGGYDHGIYTSGAGTLIENCQFHHNAGWGIHKYPSGDDFIIRNNLCYSNAQSQKLGAPNGGGAGIGLYGGSRALVYRNVVWDNDIGIASNYGENGPRIFNNTVYANSGTYSLGVDIGAGCTGAVVKNNILRSNAGGDLTIEGDAIASSNMTADPMFTDPGSADFTLQAGSPAIDAGEFLDGISYTGAAPDLGAEEYGADDLPIIDITITPNPLPPDGSGTITWDSNGDSVDIPGVGTGLPPSGSADLPAGTTLVTAQAYNDNGSSQVQQAVGTFASGLIYRATVSYMPKSIKGGSDLSVDNMEIIGLMPNKVKAIALGILIEGLSDEDLRVGRLDHAGIELFHVDYENPAAGRVILPGSGNIGQIKMQRSTHQTEFRGKTLYLQQMIGDLTSALCRARLGDDIDDYRVAGFGCHVRLDPPFWERHVNYTARENYDAATGSVIKPNVYNGRHFRCVTAGLAGDFEPIWDTRVGANTADGAAVWETILALTVFGSVTTALDTRFFSDATRSEPPTVSTGIATGTAQYAISDANLAGNYFEVLGDLTAYFNTGATFAVTGSPGNDGTYTVVTATLVGASTRLEVSETIPDTQAGGYVTAPFAAATGFFDFGKLTFTTGANIGISKEVKSFILTPYAVLSVNQGTKTIEIDGDQTAFFTVGQHLALNGSTGNDAEYDVTAVSYSSGTDRTSVILFQAIPDATADGFLLAGPGQFEMFERFPFDIQVGDEYLLEAGCDLSKEICKVKFDNVYNRRAEDGIPGNDAATTFPSQQL